MLYATYTFIHIHYHNFFNKLLQKKTPFGFHATKSTRLLSGHILQDFFWGGWWGTNKDKSLAVFVQKMSV
jgi:hypothetical protein